MPFVSSVRGSYGSQGRRPRETGRLANATGGTITSAGGYRIHTFTAVGTSTFVADVAGNVEYLIVAGGGGGGQDVGGGGGAGGLLSGSAAIPQGNNSIVVGARGAGGTASGGSAPNGSNSSAISLTAIGGGGGGNYSGGSGANGGSGGGGSGYTVNGSPGSGTGGQGYSGGPTGGSSTNGRVGAGGGGAGGVGEAQKDVNTNPWPSVLPVNGGVGVSNSISGSSVTYASGGGAWGDGIGSGAVMAAPTRYGEGGVGSGTGGLALGLATNESGFYGYQGIVIIRYPV